MPTPHKNTDEKADRATQAAGEATRAAADGAAEASQQAVRASAEIAQSSAETVRQIMQSGLNVATQAAERSVEQFTSIFGLSGERAENGRIGSAFTLGCPRIAVVKGSPARPIPRPFSNFATGPCR